MTFFPKNYIFDVIAKKLIFYGFVIEIVIYYKSMTTYTFSIFHYAQINYQDTKSLQLFDTYMKTEYRKKKYIKL